MAALLQLTEHSSEAVVRRALKLLATRISSLDLQEQVCCVPLHSEALHIVRALSLPWHHHMLCIDAFSALTGLRPLFVTCVVVHALCNNTDKASDYTAGALHIALSLSITSRLTLSVVFVAGRPGFAARQGESRGAGRHSPTAVQCCTRSVRHRSATTPFINVLNMCMLTGSIHVAPGIMIIRRSAVSGDCHSLLDLCPRLSGINHAAADKCFTCAVYAVIQQLSQAVFV